LIPDDNDNDEEQYKKIVVVNNCESKNQDYEDNIYEATKISMFNTGESVIDKTQPNNENEPQTIMTKKDTSLQKLYGGLNSSPISKS
jgi:hypothetical protein